MQFRDPSSGKSFVRKVRRVADEPGCAYELTFCCFHGYRFLEKERVRCWFVEAMIEARKRLKFDLWAYVIMPEHVHLLVYPGESGASAGQIRGKIKELAARPAIAFLTARFTLFDLAECDPQISQRDADEEQKASAAGWHAQSLRWAWSHGTDFPVIIAPLLTSDLIE